MDNDERLGLPSASEAHRIYACPGYLNLKRALPELPEVSSPDAESGTKIASVLAGLYPDTTLTDDELKTFEKLVRGRDMLMTLVFLSTTPEEFSCEKRLWLTNTQGKLFSGKYDALYISGTTGLIVDDKSGRNGVAEAQGNLQLRTLAVLVKGEHPAVTRIVVAINQPWFSTPYSLAEYDEADLLRARIELIDNLANAIPADAIRTPGGHCKYCKCLRANTCPEALAEPAALAVINPATLATGDQLAAFLDRVALAEDVIEAVKKEAKRRLEAGEVVPGWSLKPGRVMEDITAPEVVHVRAAALGVAPHEFMEAVKLQKGALKDVIKRATAKRGKELDAEMDALLAGCTTERIAAPSLAKDNT